MTQEGLEQVADFAIRPPIVINAPAELLTCKVCGGTYVSLGKHDPGNLCKACERELSAKSAPLIGGPLDGQVISNDQGRLSQNDLGRPEAAGDIAQRSGQPAQGEGKPEIPVEASDMGDGPDSRLYPELRDRTGVIEMKSKVEAATTWMEHLAEDNSHGYQWGGWGPRDYDCGHAIITAWEEAGVPVKSRGQASYTGNMQPAFTACGFKDVTGSVNTRTGSGLKRGDVLINTINHAAMYIGQGKLVHARSAEGNTIPGDQNGREICTQPYFDYPWNCVLRYPESISYDEDAEETIPGPEPLKADGICGRATWEALAKYLPTLQHGSNGPIVEVLQEALNKANGSKLVIDGDFGDNTELQLREFQEGSL